MRQLKLLILVWGLASLSGCRTTGQVTRIDVEKRRFELQSQDDTKSAMRTTEDPLTRRLVESLEKRLKAQPRDVNALINMAQAQLALGRYDRAESYCRDTLRVDLKNETAKKILAQIYYRRGNLEMARVILNGMDAQNSQDSQVLNLLGLIALRQNQPEKALFHFQEALRHNPSDLAVRMNLGVLYVHYRQLGLAAVEFERVLKVMPEHPDANLHLAIIESNRGQLERAEQLYKDVLRHAEENPVAIFNLAVLEERRKNFEAAIDYLKRFLETDFARRKNNQEVFALIERIKTSQEALTGRPVSDQDIMQLAARKVPNRADARSRDQEFVEADPRQQKSMQPDSDLKSPSSLVRDDTQDSAEQDPQDDATPSSTEKADTNNKDAKGQNKPKVEKSRDAKESKKQPRFRSDEDEIKELEKQLQ